MSSYPAKDKPGAASPRTPETPVGPVSSYVKRSLKYRPADDLQRALDLPCGRGRNAIWLAREGIDVVAADIDEASIATLRRVTSGTEEAQRIACVRLSANERLPFPDAVFDLATVVHFVSFPLIAELSRSLKPGGLLVFETFAGNGGNWKALPAPGVVRDCLRPDFELLDYSERLVGPVGMQAAVVKATARRR